MGGSTRCTSVVCKFPEDGATLKAHLRKLGPTVWLVQQKRKKNNDHGDINKHAKHDAIVPSLLQDLFQLSHVFQFGGATFSATRDDCFLLNDLFVAKGRMNSIIAFPCRNASSQTQKTSQGG